MERSRAKWTCFAWEARQLTEIDANTADQDALRQPGARLCRNRNPQVRALSIIGPAGGKAPRQGKSPRKAAILYLGPVLVAKNLHLMEFVLIFRGNSG